MRKVRFRDRGGMIKTGDWTDSGIEFSGELVDPAGVEILSPVTPSKIIAASKNNIDYAEQAGWEIPDRPVFCLKTPNTVSAHEDEVRLLPDKEIKYAGELGVVIGEQCRNVSADDAMEYVAGFTCSNDMTNTTNKDDFYVYVKAFDNSTPLGPVVVPKEEVPSDAEITLRINGERKQHTTRDRFYYSEAELVAYLSAYMTLEPGDVILTGSPPNDAPLHDGDRVEVEIEGIGTLCHDTTRA